MALGGTIPLFPGAREFRGKSGLTGGGVLGRPVRLQRQAAGCCERLVPLLCRPRPWLRAGDLALSDPNTLNAKNTALSDACK